MDDAHKAEPGHSASEKEIEYLCNRLNRISGHLRSVRKMVEEGEDCSKVLIQLSAVSGALSGIGKYVLMQYLDECLDDVLTTGDATKIEQFKELMNRFTK